MNHNYLSEISLITESHLAMRRACYAIMDQRAEIQQSHGRKNKERHVLFVSTEITPYNNAAVKRHFICPDMDKEISCYTADC